MPEVKKRRRKHTRKKRSPKKSSVNMRRLPVLLLLPVLGYLIVASFQQIKANAINSQTQTYLEFWEQEYKEDGGGFSIKESDLQQARAGAERAVQIEPNNPELQAGLAKVEDWSVINNQLQGTQPDSLRQEQGLQAYRKAILARPAWPYAWADFAMAKARAREIDEEFMAALERATTLGPWESRVMSTVAQLGLLYQEWLPIPVQQVTDGNLERFSQRSPWQAIKLARNTPSLEKVCRWVKNPQKFKKDCGGFLQGPS